MNIVTQGEIANVIDHRKCIEEQAVDNQPKKHFSVYELQIEYENQFEKENTDSKFQWAPFTLIYQQVPRLVQEYFSLKALNIEAILNEEVEARQQFYNNKKGRGGRNWNGKNRNHNGGQNQKDLPAHDPTPREYVDRSFDYLAKQTLFVTDKYQLGKDLNCQPTGEGKHKAKKKRLKRFLETEQAELEKKIHVKDKNEWSSAQPTFVNGWFRGGRHEQNVITQKKLNQVTKFGEDIAMADDEARLKPPTEQRATATSTLAPQDEDGYFIIQNPAVTFEELNLKDVRKDRKDHEEEQRQAGNQGSQQKNDDQEDINYYPNTFTKEDRRKNLQLNSLLDNDKTKKPNATGDWMSELKNPNTAPQESKDVWAPGKQSDQVINLETSDDDLKIESDYNVMVVDEFMKKEKQGKMNSPLVLDDDEVEPNPYEHTTTQAERNRLYTKQNEDVEFDKNPWLQQRFKQKKVIEKQLQQASEYEKIQSFYSSQQNEAKPSEFISSLVDDPSANSLTSALQPKVSQAQEKKQQVLEVGKNQLQQIFKVGFRPPQSTTQGSSGETEVLLDCPQDHPGLVERNGTPWTNIPKMIHGMRICEHTNQVMYLVSWEQDYLQYFYTPSWVLSQLLIASGCDNNTIEQSQMNNYKLIAEFYHYFATNSTLYQVKEKESPANSPTEKKPILTPPSPPTSHPKKIDRAKMMTKDDWRMKMGM